MSSCQSALGPCRQGNLCTRQHPWSRCTCPSRTQCTPSGRYLVGICLQGTPSKTGIPCYLRICLQHKQCMCLHRRRSRCLQRKQSKTPRSSKRTCQPGKMYMPALLPRSMCQANKPCKSQTLLHSTYLQRMCHKKPFQCCSGTYLQRTTCTCSIPPRCTCLPHSPCMTPHPRWRCTRQHKLSKIPARPCPGKCPGCSHCKSRHLLPTPCPPHSPCTSRTPRSSRCRRCSCCTPRCRWRCCCTCRRCTPHTQTCSCCTCQPSTRCKQPGHQMSPRSRRRSLDTSIGLSATGTCPPHTASSSADPSGSGTGPPGKRHTTALP